ncbi:MAG: glycosyltransferase family 2 protein [Bacteroidales bacterium]|nr:glycosyltransferase family 2 protein [Bacteroidales bacterium]
MLYVILPCYNSERYLSKCLDSIFNQTFKDFLLVVVNDGSTDSTQIFLNSYINKHKNIVLIDQSNQGSSSARNHGLEFVLSKSNEKDIITFIDSDDYIKEDYFETHMGLLNEYNSDIVCSGYIVNNINKNKFKKVKVLNKEDAVKSILKDFLINSHSHHKFYKCKMWQNVFYPKNLSLFEDVATIYKTFLNSSTVVCTPYCGYYYVMHSENSISHSKATNKNIFSTLEAIKLQINFINESEYKNKKYLKILKHNFAHRLISKYSRLDLINCEPTDLEKAQEMLKFYRENKCSRYYFPLSFKLFIRKIIFNINPKTYYNIFHKK